MIANIQSCQGTVYACAIQQQRERLEELKPNNFSQRERRNLERRDITALASEMPSKEAYEKYHSKT